MITKKDLLEAQAAADELFPELSPVSSTAQAPLDADQEQPAPDPAHPANIQGTPHQSSTAVAASPAVTLTPSYCEKELAHMVAVQRHVLASLRECLPLCAAANAKSRALVSELLRVTEDQSGFILQIKTNLAMSDYKSRNKS